MIFYVSLCFLKGISKQESFLSALFAFEICCSKRNGFTLNIVCDYMAHNDVRNNRLHKCALTHHTSLLHYHIHTINLDIIYNIN